MKRRMLSLLAALLTALALTAHAATPDAIFYDQTATLDDSQFSGPVARSIEAFGGALYILDDFGEIYRLGPGDAEPQPFTAVPEEVERAYTAVLAASGGDLYLLSLEDEVVCRLEGEAFALCLEPDLSALREAGVAGLSMPVAVEGTLYALGSSTQLVSLSLSDGLARVAQIPRTTSLCAYRDGALLATLARTQDEPARVCVMDTAGGVRETLCTLPGTGAAVYDADADAIYAYSAGQILRLGADGGLTSVNYLPEAFADRLTDAAFFPPDGFALVSEWACLAVRSVAPEVAPAAPVRISGMMSGDPEEAFARAHPETPLLNDARFFTADEVVQAIRGGEASVDVYKLSSVYDVSALIDQGFAEPLNTPSIAGAVGRMYESAQAYVARDGVPYAVPYEVQLGVMRANDALLLQFGFDAPPRTVRAYVDMAKDWRERFGGEHDEYVLDLGAQHVSKLGEANYATQALYIALSQYVAATEARGEEVRFDAPAFVSLLEAIASLPAPQVLEGEGGRYRYYAESALLDTDYRLSLNSQAEPKKEGTILPLPAAVEDAPALVDARMGVYLLNPNSKNKEAAMRFLEWTAENPLPLTGYILYPDRNEPLEYESWQAGRKEREARRDDLLLRLETASEAERGDIEAQLAQWAVWEEGWERDSRWLFSPQDVERLRALTPYMDFGAGSLRRTLMQGGFGELDDIAARFLLGELDARQAAQEMERKASMWRMEP